MIDLSITVRLRRTSAIVKQPWAACRSEWIGMPERWRFGDTSWGAIAAVIRQSVTKERRR